jgi:hypothetical protein
MEAVLRDRMVDPTMPYVIQVSELAQYTCSTWKIVSPLRLLDATPVGLSRNRMPTDVTGACDYALSQAWSLAIHQHRDVPDGLIYRSRLADTRNIAVFDRARDRMSIKRVITHDLQSMDRELKPILDALGIVVVP